MLIHKIIPSIDYNWWLKRLDTQLNKTTNKNPLKVPEVIKPTIKKTLLQNFWDYRNTSLSFSEYDIYFTHRVIGRAPRIEKR